MRFRSGCLFSTAGFASQLIFFSAAPLVLMQTLKIPPDRFGLFFAADALAVVAGSLLNSWLSGRVSETSLLTGKGTAVALSPFSTLAGTASALLTAIQMSAAALIAAGVITFCQDDWSVMIHAYLLLATGAGAVRLFQRRKTT